MPQAAGLTQVKLHMCINTIHVVNTSRIEPQGASSALEVKPHLQLVKTGARLLCPKCSLHAPSWAPAAEGCASCWMAATVHCVAQMAPSRHINHIGGPHAMLTKRLLVSSFSTRWLDWLNCLPSIAWHDTGSQTATNQQTSAMCGSLGHGRDRPHFDTGTMRALL